MKNLSEYLLESIDADDSVRTLSKKWVGKTIKISELDKFKKELKKENWEYVSKEEEESECFELVFVGNFSNNAEEDDEYLHIKFEQQDEKYKIVSCEVE